jgi:hypothetical protein
MQWRLGLYIMKYMPVAAWLVQSGYLSVAAWFIHSGISARGGLVNTVECQWGVGLLL